VVVADGALHALNFETLPVGGAGSRHYWIEDAEIQIRTGVVDAVRTVDRIGDRARRCCSSATRRRGHRISRR